MRVPSNPMDQLREALFGPLHNSMSLADIVREFALTIHGGHHHWNEMGGVTAKFRVTQWLHHVDIICPDTLSSRILLGDALEDSHSVYDAIRATRDVVASFDRFVDPIENICHIWDEHFPGFLKSAYPERYAAHVHVQSLINHTFNRTFR
jgi:hypothetical protein